jgi:hypothetical protein
MVSNEVMLPFGIALFAIGVLEQPRTNNRAIIAKLKLEKIFNFIRLGIAKTAIIF